MAVKLYKHILKDKPLPLCLCLTVPDCRLTFLHSSAQAVKLRSSYTICFDLDSSSADCDLLHNTALNAFIRGSANLWPSSQQDSGFLFMAVWRLFSRRLSYSLFKLHLVSFDSSTRLSSGPPWPLQASLSLPRWTEKLLQIDSWNSKIYENNGKIGAEK